MCVDICWTSFNVENVLFVSRHMVFSFNFFKIVSVHLNNLELLNPQFNLLSTFSPDFFKF